jgi:hypothetical protein
MNYLGAKKSQSIKARAMSLMCVKVKARLLKKGLLESKMFRFMRTDFRLESSGLV